MTGNYREKNKRRARAMENRVAHYLSGQRVPMSGAGKMKGDVRVHCAKGDFLIECKLSEHTHPRTNEPGIDFEFAWMNKIHQEAVGTPGIKHGVVVIHYHAETRADYVVMSPEALSYFSVQPIETSTLIYYSSKVGQKSSIWYRNTLVNALEASRMVERIPMRAVICYLDTHPYIIMPLVDFKDMLDTLDISAASVVACKQGKQAEQAAILAALTPQEKFTSWKRDVLNGKETTDDNSRLD